MVPEDRLLVSESGIKTRDDIARLKNAGVSCFLVGENLLKEPNLAIATKNLIS
jgi:indole-3-glycerol phosphate synthase